MTDIDWKARAEAAEARVRELEARLTVTDEMVERLMSSLFGEDWRDGAEAFEIEEHLADARAALTAALEGKE